MFERQKWRVIGIDLVVIADFCIKPVSLIYLPVNGFPIDASNVVLVATKGTLKISGLTVPQTHDFVHASRGQFSAVRGPFNA